MRSTAAPLSSLAAALIKMIKKKEAENPLSDLNEKTEKGLISMLQEANLNPTVIDKMRTGDDLIKHVERASKLLTIQ